jgi:hypothetical protein
MQGQMRRATALQTGEARQTAVETTRDEIVTVGTVFILVCSARRQAGHTLDGALGTTPWALWHVEAREGSAWAW